MLSRIKFILKERKISQKQLAEAAGISAWTLTHQLNGIYKLNVDVLLALCRLCPNLSAEWLLRGTGDIFRADTHDIIRRIDVIDAKIDDISSKIHNT